MIKRPGIGFLAVLATVIGCNTHLPRAPQTAAWNEHEVALRRVVLPGVAAFDGRLIDRARLLKWVETEAKLCDPEKTKVQFVCHVNDADVSAENKGCWQREFHYGAITKDTRITLPDAVKLYAALLGLRLEFRENAVVVSDMVASDATDK